MVLTTYEMLSLEARPGAPKTLRRVHWWRVVLDESQRLPRPAGVSGSSAFAAIARECAELSRTHSWLMSGTPAGSVVDDLLGQLIFLGGEPYCNRGADGDAFWEREISARWKARDPEALEVVHDLLGQIMMRHSKEQTMADGADGEVKEGEEGDRAGGDGGARPRLSQRRPHLCKDEGGLRRVVGVRWSGCHQGEGWARARAGAGAAAAAAWMWHCIAFISRGKARSSPLTLSGHRDTPAVGRSA